ncbi:MAG: FISUMP domain-containing protein [Bacteroidales bacterium]|nr:FISUMP domain-containing protein [Bacteroidales bacterium]
MNSNVVTGNTGLLLFLFSFLLPFLLPSCQQETETASYPQHKLQLETSPEEAGVVYGSGSYNEDEQVSLMAIAHNGYRFTHWSDAGQNKLHKYAYFSYIMPGSDMLLTANFKVHENNEDSFNTVTDVDGNVYKTVVIGAQEWMAENLRTRRYADGTKIPMLESDPQLDENNTGGYIVYPHTIVEDIHSEEEMLQAYGLLYNWYVVEKDNNICPEGWRVPSDRDWTALNTYLGTNGFDAGSLKGTRVAPDAHPRWELPNADATNETGFSAYPSGYRQVNGSFQLQGQAAFFWTSTKSTGIPTDEEPEEFFKPAGTKTAAASGKKELPEMAYFSMLQSENNNLDILNLDKQTEMSIRCIRN